MMNCLVKCESKFDLKKIPFDKMANNLKEQLNQRVSEAYIFGSYAIGTHRSDSDVDIIIVKNTTTSFPDRALEFKDLFDIYPNLDIIVYTPEELQKQLQTNVGFWKSVKQTLTRII